MYTTTTKADLWNYIVNVTYHIWEKRNIDSIRQYYHKDIKMHLPSCDIQGVESVVVSTFEMLNVFPNRRLLPEDVIASSSKDLLYSSHRIINVMNRTGNGLYGEKQNKRHLNEVVIRGIADCLIKENQVIEEWLVRDASGLLRQLGIDWKSYAHKQAIQNFQPEKECWHHKKCQETSHPDYNNSPQEAINYAETLKKIWEQGKLSRLAEYYHPAVRVEIPNAQTLYGIEKLNQFYFGYLSSFTNIKFCCDYLAQEESPEMPKKIAIRWSLRTEHNGNGYFGKPSNEKVYILGISHAYISQGKIIAEWHCLDEVAIYEQICYNSLCKRKLMVKILNNNKYHKMKNIYKNRIVRYADLVPCKNAFVDSRTPGSDQKENFTVVGPGVSENPNQYVHIPLPHGFNIGGARQPAGCLNSQHSHDTAEVFIVHSGKWKFFLGVNREDGEVELEKGDTISLPTKMFRGFENTGNSVGYLFAVLGGDDPGKVTWAPSVFDLAKKYGLVLLKGGKLIDTTVGEKIPEGGIPETPPSIEEINQLTTPTIEKIQQCVCRYQHLQSNSNSLLSTENIEEAPIITEKPTGDFFSESPIKSWWEHGFNLRHLKIKSGATTRKHSRQEEEVIMQHSGTLQIILEKDEIVLGAGDHISISKNELRSFCASSSEDSCSFIVRGGIPAIPNFQ